MMNAKLVKEINSGVAGRKIKKVAKEIGGSYHGFSMGRPWPIETFLGVDMEKMVKEVPQCFKHDICKKPFLIEDWQPEFEIAIKYIISHIGEKPVYKVEPLYNGIKDIKEINSAIEWLKGVDGYNSDYNRYGRVSYITLNNLISNEDVLEYVKKYSSDGGWGETVYDDTCGLGGGHHTPYDTSTKAFIVVDALKHVLKMDWKAVKVVKA